MTSRKMRLFSPFAMLMLVTALFLGTAASAFAADTWLPNFGGTQDNVQVDSRLVGTVISESTVSQLKTDLAHRSQAEGIQYFFVYTQLGDEKVGPGFGDALTSRLTTSWQSKPGFPAETYQIILVVRDAKGRHLYALNGGNLIQKEGLTPTFKSIGDDAFHTYMPNDPAGFALAVADKINGEAHTYHFWHVTIWYIVGIGTPALLLLIMLVLTLIARSKMSGLLEKWRQNALHCGDLADKLEGSHMGFLKQQAVFAAAFADDTKVRFDEACGNYKNLVSRQLAIQDLYDRAVKAAGSAWVFWTANAVSAMLTTKPDKWTGNELPDSKKTLKDWYETISWNKPQELLDGFDALYTKTDDELKEIAEAFRKTTENAAAIKTMLGEIDKVRPQLENEAQLPFGPYQPRYDELSKRGSKVLDLMASNPIGAQKESEAVEQGIEALKADILRAIAIKKSYTDTETAITGATQRAATVRATAVGFNYPFIKDEEHPTATGDKFLLTEEAGNPDGAIKEANQHYGASKTALLAAQLDTADKEKKEAERCAALAVSIVNTVLADKKYVEEHVLPFRTDLASLVSETPAAETAMKTDLTVNFIAANYAGVKDNVTTAHTVANTTESQLGKARAAYHAQKFVAAKAIVEGTGSAIASARQGLAAVHSRLAELKQLRDHAKTTAAQVNQLNGSLATKRTQLDHYTSANTDRSLSNQQVPVQTLVTEVAKSVADWVWAARNADQLLATLQECDRLINADKAAYDTAATRVQELSTAIKAAEGEQWQPGPVAQDDTRQPARDKLNEAVGVLSSATRTLQTPKSNWTSATSSIDTAKQAVTQAVQMAEEDHRLATAARASLQAAGEKIQGVINTDYERSESIGGQYKRFDADADCSTAEATLRQAQGYMRGRDYENAKSYADRAWQQAEDARQAAVNAVGVLIGAAIQAYNDSLPKETPGTGNGGFGGNQGGGFENPGRTVSNDTFQGDSRTVTGGDENFGQ